MAGPDPGRGDGRGSRTARAPAGRADLLAQVAGLEEGFGEGQVGEKLARQAAGLCRKAGADPTLIPGWVEEGRRRRATAGRPPFSAPDYRRPGRPGGARQDQAPA
jgi:hypothetical protein